MGHSNWDEVQHPKTFAPEGKRNPEVSGKLLDLSFNSGVLSWMRKAWMGDYNRYAASSGLFQQLLFPKVEEFFDALRSSSRVSLETVGLDVDTPTPSLH